MKFRLPVRSLFSLQLLAVFPLCSCIHIAFCKSLAWLAGERTPYSIYNERQVRLYTGRRAKDMGTEVLFVFFWSLSSRDADPPECRVQPLAALRVVELEVGETEVASREQPLVEHPDSDAEEEGSAAPLR